MSFLLLLLKGVEVIVALVIIVLVMVQRPKSSGLGGLAGGLGEEAFGSGAAALARKLTVGFAIFFAVNTLGLVMLEGLVKSRTRRSAAEAAIQDVRKDSAKPDAAVTPDEAAPDAGMKPAGAPDPDALLTPPEDAEDAAPQDN